MEKPKAILFKAEKKYSFFFMVSLKMIDNTVLIINIAKAMIKGTQAFEKGKNAETEVTMVLKSRKKVKGMNIIEEIIQV